MIKADELTQVLELFLILVHHCFFVKFVGARNCSILALKVKMVYERKKKKSFILRNKAMVSAEERKNICFSCSYWLFLIAVSDFVCMNNLLLGNRCLIITVCLLITGTYVTERESKRLCI